MILNLLTTIVAANSLSGRVNASNILLQTQNTISEQSMYVANSIGLTNLKSDQNLVKDLDGNVFLVQESFNDGFMIFDPVAGKSIEAVLTAQCPYDFDSEKEYYYFGPSNYFYRQGNSFYHCLLCDVENSLDDVRFLQDAFSEKMMAFRKESSTEITKERASEARLLSPGIPLDYYEPHYISNYQIVRDCEYPTNWDGSCGFVSASIILHYWDRTVHDGIVNSAFKDSISRELNSTTTFSPATNLKDKLVQYNGNNVASTGRTVSDAVNKYCNDYGIKGSCSWWLAVGGIEDIIAQDKPVSIFGLLPNVGGNGLVAHAVTCFGHTNTDYVVNYGWSGYNEVSLNKTFCLYGEFMTFNVNENYYKKTYTIKPSDYGFLSSYAPNEIEQAVDIDDLHFDTKRFRCGYIENQYINISPRKQGYNTAYLKYKFKNPITSLSAKMSFWSSKEMYDSNACAYFMSKPLYTNGDSDWIQNIDLLRDVNLSTDRNNQTTINITFPNKTCEISIYAHFYTMSAPTDRNKGRISIGNLTINTYF